MKNIRLLSLLLFMVIVIVVSLKSHSSYASGSATVVLNEFQEYQSIPTNGPWDWEHFTIGDDHFLAVANRYNDSSFNIDSNIYKWNGTNFVLFQSIPTNGPINWEYFNINDDHFLAIANNYTGTTFSVNSKIYKWNGSSFVEFQSFPTNGAVDWEYFSIDGDSYLAVTNAFIPNTFSKIYRWNGAEFVEFQSIFTHGATDWEYFVIAGDHYLVVANDFNDSSWNIDSKIYKWNGSSFVEFQSIPTSGARDWEYFVLDGESYLAVANFIDGSTGDINSKIYKWNGNSFVEFQSIFTHRAIDWEYFTIGQDTYLALANSRDDTTFNIDSKIYKWDGFRFVEFQTILTHGARGWEFFTIGNDSYLVVANSHDGSSSNIDSIIYKAEVITQVEGLVAYYPFNGNVNDESGNGYHGTRYGATLTIDRLGNSDSAYKFNGSSNAIVVPGNELKLEFPEDSDLTLSAWFKMDDYNSDHTIIVAMESGRSVQTRASLRIDSNGYPYYYALAFPRELYGSEPIPLNEWHHIAAVHDGEDAKLYLDGALIAHNPDFGALTPPYLECTSNGGSLPFQNTCVSLAIGAWTDWWGVEESVFNGTIDEVRLYNRALSHRDIIELYCVTCPFPIPMPVTVASTNPTANAVGSYTTPVSVTLSATAAAGFTIDATYYTIDGGPTQTYTAPFTVSGIGNHTVQYWSVDNLGVFELTKTLSINIDPLRIENTAIPDIYAGEAYSYQLPAVGGVPPYSWSIDIPGALPTGMTLGANGVLSGTTIVVGSYNFTATVTDVDGAEVTQTYTVDVVTPPLVITTPSLLPEGTLGVPYYADLEAEGGLAPYTWSVVGGNLPEGLTLDANSGEISGTPTAAGAFGFIIQVEDATDQFVTGSFTFEQPIIDIPPNNDGGGGSGSGGGGVIITPPDPEETCTNYRIIAGSLPDGITLDPDTGQFIGAPEDGGEYNVTIGCDYGAGQTATKAFIIIINNPAPTLVSLSPASGVVGDGDTVITLTGTNFVQSSVARWNGSDRPTTYLSATELEMTVSAADLAAVGSGSITVFNAEPTGGESNALTFDIVLPNLPPDAVDDVVSTDEDVTATFAVLANDTDPDHDVLTIVSFTQPTHGVAVLNIEGTITYTPTADYNGSDSLSYTIADAYNEQDSAAINITVIPVNDAPVIDVDAALVTVDEGPAATNSGTIADIDSSNIVLSATVGIVTNNGDGSWSWSLTDTDGPSDSQTVTITAADGDGGMASVEFDLVVHNVAPTIEEIVYNNSLILGESSLITVVATDPIDSLTFAFDCNDDGTFETGPQVSNEATCTFAEVGEYLLHVQVDDGDGGVVTDSVVVTVQSQAESIDDLRTDLEELKDAGVLNNGETNGLATKLDNAIRKLEQGKPVEAIHQLNSFIEKVNEYVTEGILTLEEAQPLIDSANRVIAAIEATR